MAGWKRALADYDNLKKDLSRERTEMRKDAVLDAAHAFIAVLDNFDQAVKFTPEIPTSYQPQATSLRSWLAGILHIRTQLETSLRDLGLEPFGAIGEAFDPNLHEIVASSPDVILSVSEGSRDSSPSAQNDMEEQVKEVIHRGWKIGERIVRPAKVIVSS